MNLTKITLIIVGLIILLMGVWGLIGTYAGVTDPQWHAALNYRGSNSNGRWLYGQEAIALFPFLD